MNKLNRKLEYSLMALKHMSFKNSGELTTAKEVSDRYHSPFDATARVMQIMAQKGLLRSEQGALGGYQLNKDLSMITLNELIETIQGPTKIAKCMAKNEPCDMQVSCNIISPIENLNKKLTDFYKSVSVQDVLLRD